ncbi:MAG: GGDEF domain-containing protein [Chloroflexi bacterium]|nr:GGDEF domain-containing protein [Chloroflexota bacterium]
MKSDHQQRGFKPQENLISILPSIVAGILLLLITTFTILFYYPTQNPVSTIALMLYGFFGSVYLLFYYLLFTASLNKARFSWVNAVISGIALGGFTVLIPEEIDYLLYIMVFIASMSASLMSTRIPSYFIVISSTLIYFVVHLISHSPDEDWIIHFGLTVSELMAIETIQQLKSIARKQINRLEIINEFSRQIVSTLDTRKIFNLLNGAFQNVIAADSYYIGIVDGDEIHLEVFYDEGEYFQNVRLKRQGTLSNWVITHQQELFLPDLRKNIELEDVDMVIIGKEKTSLSWMGVPMRGLHVDGVMVISSYHANAFDRSDMELLSNIAQRAALALDNTYQHALVEEQTRLDSLTRVYNHSYFIQVLHKQAQSCLAEDQPLSLIMLDIDFFKQYNDTYGHLVGDEVLTSLCSVIRTHIKNTDAVGRWGGEEFAISLPNTNGEQAAHIAERIRETMSLLRLQVNSQKTIPSPTVSQGIAVFPAETEDITKLIDLSDNRLYEAKKRGRDQIEPATTFWETIVSK